MVMGVMKRMANARIETLVETLVAEIIQDDAIELVDVEYVREKDWYLRVYLDKPDGIELEDCQWVSEKLAEKLDEMDPIPDSYYLEVSSPGLDRELRKDRDFVRYQGEKVELHTYAPFNGAKDFVGILRGLREKIITLEIDGKPCEFPQDKVAKVRLYLEF